MGPSVYPGKLKRSDNQLFHIRCDSKLNLERLEDQLEVKRILIRGGDISRISIISQHLNKYWTDMSKELLIK